MQSEEEALYLINMVCETNDDVRNALYEIYEPMINYLVSKYIKAARNLGLEQNDLQQEALVAFTDAINNYDEKKDTLLKTFISLCIERRLKKVIEKASNSKSKFEKEILSLDYEYQEHNGALMDVLGSEEFDPLVKFSLEEEIKLLEESIEKRLSKKEYEVYKLLKIGMNYQEIASKLNKTPKQIDNTIQRLKSKVKLLKEGE